MEAREVLTQFYPFSVQGNIIIRKWCSLNFIKITLIWTDMYDIKSVIGTEVHNIRYMGV